MARLTTATATSMMFIGSRSCCSATDHSDGGFSLVIWFGPCCDSRVAASDAVRPTRSSEPSAATTAAASWL